MIGQFNRWMRCVVPAQFALWMIVLGTLLAWVVNSLVILWTSYSIMGVAPLTDLFDAPISLHLAFLATLATAAGALRAAWQHPLAMRPYGSWLAQSPWQHPQPLPMGPLRLAWQDLVVLAAIAMAACLPPTNRAAIIGLPALYLVAYVVAISAVAWLVDLRWPAVSILFTFATAIYIQSVFIAAACLVLILLIAQTTIDATLWDFPYDEQRRRDLGLLPIRKPVEVRLAWPVSPEHVTHWYSRIRSRDAFFVAATVGWLMYAVAYFNRDDSDVVDGLMFFHRLVAFAVLARVVVYVIDHYPPISLLGRWATRRFFVPGYDKVFVAPLVAGLTAYFLPGLLNRAGVSPLAAVPIATAATLWIAAAMPPKWEDWHYTGHFREVVAPRDRKEYVESLV